MITELYHFNEHNVNYLSRLALRDGATNEQQRSRMRRILAAAIEQELTDMQRYCLTEVYLNGRKQNELARDMRVNPSTVCRHIKIAMQKLKKVASYYE